MKWGGTSTIEGMGLCRSHGPLPLHPWPPQASRTCHPPLPAALARKAGVRLSFRPGGRGVLTEMIQMKKFNTIDGLPAAPLYPLTGPAPPVALKATAVSVAQRPETHNTPSTCTIAGRHAPYLRVMLTSNNLPIPNPLISSSFYSSSSHLCSSSTCWSADWMLMDRGASTSGLHLHACRRFGPFVNRLATVLSVGRGRIKAMMKHFPSHNSTKPQQPGGQLKSTEQKFI